MTFDLDYMDKIKKEKNCDGCTHDGTGDQACVDCDSGILLCVNIDNKYKVIQEADGRLHALRYGEEWRDLCGDNLVLAMAQKIEELEEALI